MRSLVLPPARPTLVRALAVPAAAVLALGVVACGEEDATADGSDVTRAQMQAGPDANGMLGLEVTALGEVSEVVADNAFRLDKDGIDPGVAEDLTPPSPGESPAYTDLTDLDRDAFVRGDEQIDLGAGQEQVLVLVPGADLDLRSGDPVRVTGTIRSLDAQAIEEVYGVEVDTDAFAPYLDQLVLVAEGVGPVDG